MECRNSSLISKVLFSLILKILILYCAYCLEEGEINCPPECICSKVRPKLQLSFADSYSLKCGSGSNKITELENLTIGNIVNNVDIISLNLSGNNLTVFSAKLGSLPALQKLDLSKNRISHIENGAFANMSALKRLDISNNKLRQLNREMFDSLNSLERLKLSQNLISHIKEGTFDDLVSLKQLDISGNPLGCDCSLWWILEWVHNTSVKLSPLPKCSAPPSLRGQPIRKIKMSTTYTGVHCNWPDETGFGMEIHPDKNQVVFEGDSLRLQCRTTDANSGMDTDSVVVWNWSGIDPVDMFQQTIHVENTHFKESGLIESVLSIDELHTNHSGQWNCMLFSSHGNHSVSISVIVLSDATEYCGFTVTTDNKGVYMWPKTVVGNRVELPCAVEGETGAAKAVNVCSMEGKWQDLDTAACPYISETTRLLQQFSQMNLSATRGSVIESARNFHNYTYYQADKIVDKMDIVYIAKTVESYVDFVPKEKELGGILLDIVNSVMKQPKALLAAAQEHANSCTRLVTAVENIAQFIPSNQSQKSNVAVGEFRVTQDSFVGLTCTWYDHGISSNTGHLFVCSTSNNTLGTKEKVVEASVQVPPSLFYQLEMQDIPAATSRQLMVAMYDNGHLFPHLSSANDSRDVMSCVIGVKLVDVEVGHLNEQPVYIMLRAGSGGIFSGSPRPAWWNSATSEWRHDGCQLSDLFHGLLIFHCYRLGYFALLQDTEQLSFTSTRIPQAKSRLSHPAVCVGTFVGTTCMLVAALTYIVCYSNIVMSNKAKHSLINMWLSLSFLCLLFSLGIYQTEEILICQIIGLMLHYFTLSSLFWMAVSLNAMYKQVNKTEVVSTNSEDVAGEAVVAGQPLVGLYLVGWGIALLVCGLSGAVNLPGYAHHNHCSLGPGPGISAVLVPAGSLVLYLLLKSLMVRCATRNLDSNVQLSEGTQATDLELLDNPVIPERSSLHSVITPSSQIEDAEHPPPTQLKAFLIVLFFYIALWISAAFSIIKPFNIPYEEIVFSFMYAFFIVNLGVFVIFFHCFARNDVRSVWFSVKPCCRSRNVSDSKPEPLPVVSSTDSVDSSSGLKSAAVNMNPVPNTANNMATSNLNFVVMHRQQYRAGRSMPVSNDAGVFYNPHQSGVARKFFKKQRRKQNNLGTRRCGDGRGSPVPQGFFTAGSKVNNTNFHVEFPSDQVSSNPNILHSNETPIERLVIGAEVPEPLLNNGSSLRPGYSTEDQVTSVVSEDGCGSCEAESQIDSELANDCGRDISAKQSCGSSHIAVSDQSDGSHLYATIDPPSPKQKRPPKTGTIATGTATNSQKSELACFNISGYRYPFQRRKSYSDIDQKSTDGSNTDKKETSV